MRRACLGAVVLTATSCLLPEYQSSGSTCTDPQIAQPYAKTLVGAGWVDVSAVDGDMCAEVYVVGRFQSDVRFDSALAFDANGIDSFVGRLQPNGEYAWVRQIGGNEDQWACCVARVPDGVVVAGDYSYELELEQEVLFSPAVSLEFHGFVMKLGADGTVAERISLSTAESFSIGPLDAGTDGRIAVGGRFRTQLGVEGTPLSLTADGTEDGFVFVLGPDLAVAWSAHISRGGDERVTGVTFADDGSLYVAGHANGEPFWQVFGPDGTTGGDIHRLDVGGGVEQGHIFPVAKGDFVYVLRGGQFISDGSTEWPMTGNIAAMRLNAQGSLGWHFELPDVGEMGIFSELGALHHDVSSGHVHLVGQVNGGQAEVVQEGQVRAALDAGADDDLMLITLHVDTGFVGLALMGDELTQHGHAVLGGAGQLVVGGEFEGSIDFPSGQRIAATASEGFLARFAWPAP